MSQLKLLVITSRPTIIYTPSLVVKTRYLGMLFTFLLILLLCVNKGDDMRSSSFRTAAGCGEAPLRVQTRQSAPLCADVRYSDNTPVSLAVHKTHNTTNYNLIEGFIPKRLYYKKVKTPQSPDHKSLRAMCQIFLTQNICANPHPSEKHFTLKKPGQDKTMWTKCFNHFLEQGHAVWRSNRLWRV